MSKIIPKNSIMRINSNLIQTLSASGFLLLEYLLQTGFSNGDYHTLECPFLNKKDLTQAKQKLAESGILKIGEGKESGMFVDLDMEKLEKLLKLKSKAMLKNNPLSPLPPPYYPPNTPYTPEKRKSRNKSNKLSILLNTKVLINLDNITLTKAPNFTEKLPLEVDGDEEWRKLIQTWLEYKRNRKETYKTSKSVELFEKKLRKMSNNDFHVASEIIENSMANNYAGIFLVQNNGNNNSPRPYNNSIGKITPKKKKFDGYI